MARSKKLISSPKTNASTEETKKSEISTYDLVIGLFRLVIMVMIIICFSVLFVSIGTKFGIGYVQSLIGRLVIRVFDMIPGFLF